MGKIKIALVDDHNLFRIGLAQILSGVDDFEIVFQATNGLEFIDKYIKNPIDVVLLDINMPELSGVEVTEMVRKQGNEKLKIIILSMHEEEKYIFHLMELGANGYLLKDMDPEKILEKLKEAALGKMVISEKLTHVLAGAIRGGSDKKSNVLAKLTSREHEILKLIAKGMSNKLIARELDISDGTVKVHVKHVLKKLELNSRVEAAVWMVNQPK